MSFMSDLPKFARAMISGEQMQALRNLEIAFEKIDARHSGLASDWLRYQQMTPRERSRFWLLRIMLYLSDYYWSAGWVIDLEFYLWQAIADPDPDAGMLTGRDPDDPRSLPRADADRLRELALHAGGWWVSEATFVPLDAWLDAYQQWAQEKARQRLGEVLTEAVVESMQKPGLAPQLLSEDSSS